jgi:hypothetical protein
MNSTVRVDLVFSVSLFIREAYHLDQFKFKIPSPAI